MAVIDRQFRTGRRHVLAGAASAAALTQLPRPGRAEGLARLKYWDMVWGPPEYIDTAKSLVAQFNAAHPAIQVEYRSISWSNWYQTFLTAIGAGSAPDMSTGAGFQAVQFFSQNAILPVDSLVASLRSSGQLQDFVPHTVETLKYQDHYVALPTAIDIRVWFYRKDLLAAAKQDVPKDWTSFRAAAKATTGGGKYGIISSGDTGGSHYVYAAIMNNGGALFTADRKVDLLSARNMEAVEFLGELVRDGSVSPASAGYSGDDARAAFYRGESAFLLDSPGIIGNAGAAAAQIGVLPPLAGPHGDKGTVYWVNNIMAYQQTRHPAQVMTFIDWWSQHEKPLWTAGHTRSLPVRKSIAADPYFTNNAELSTVIAEYVPIGKTIAAASPGVFPALNDVEGEGTFQTLVQQLWQGKPVKEIMQAANAHLLTIVSD